LAKSSPSDAKIIALLAFDYERFDFGFFKLNNGETVYDTLYIPLRFSDQIYRNLKPHDDSAVRYWMTDKYRFLGLDTKLWETIQLERNLEKENRLFDIVVGDVNLEYDFYNSFYQNSLNIDIGLEKYINNNRRLIKMEKIEGYSMVDWSTIIEKAKTVHTVSTSLIYMIQNIKKDGVCYYIYPRLPEKGFISIEEFLPDYWNKMYI
jgi:hypothetical protein